MRIGSAAARADLTPARALGGRSRRSNSRDLPRWSDACATVGAQDTVRAMARLALLAVLIFFFLAGCGKNEAREERSQSAPIENFGFTNVARNAPPVASGETIAGEQARIAPGSVMRFTIQWRLVQPTPDAPLDWALYDRDIVRTALAEGLRPLVVVAAAPEWAWGDGVCAPENLAARGYCYMPPGDDPRSLTAWGDWVAAVAKRYGDDAVALEVWNEPNGGGFWNTTERPDPEHYARVLCEAYDAVSAVSPDLPVVSGGLATSFDTDARHVSAGEFLTGLYGATDSRRCMDGIGIHPYPRQDSPA